MNLFGAQLLLLVTTREIIAQTVASPNSIIWFPIDGITGGFYSSQGEIFLKTSPSQWRVRRSVRPEDMREWNTRPLQRVNRFRKGYPQPTPNVGRNHRSLGSNNPFQQADNFLTAGNKQDNQIGRDRFDFEKFFSEYFGNEFFDRLDGPPPATESSWVNDAITFPDENKARQIFPSDDDSTEQIGSTDCERYCPKTQEYNPVCGSDFRNYHNYGNLKCAMICGRRVTFAHYGVCGGKLPLIFRPGPRAEPRRRPTQEFGDDWRVF